MVSVQIAKGITTQHIYLVFKITQKLVQTDKTCAVRGAWRGHGQRRGIEDT